jgi:hypothetical protein
MTSASSSTQLIHPSVLHSTLQARVDELEARKVERAAARQARHQRRKRNPFVFMAAVLATLGMALTLGAGLIVANPALDAHLCDPEDADADLLADGFDCTYLFNKGQGPDEAPVGELYVKRDASDNLILVTDLDTLSDTGHEDAKLCVDDDTDPINLSVTDPDNTVSCLGNTAGTSINHGEALPDADAGEEDPGDYEVIIQNLVEGELDGLAMYTIFVDGYTEFSLHFNEGDLSIESFFQADAPGTKSGTKFEDLDGDGVWDLDEPGLEGWTINAYADDGDGVLSQDEFDAGAAATDDTDMDGFYELTLDPGDYVVCEVLASGWTQTFPAAGDGDCSIDDSLGPNGYAVTIVGGDEHEDNDFGNFELITKSGSKFEDLDGDGVWDIGEPGLDGWTINLYLDDGDGAPDASDTLVDSVVTGDGIWATGFYEFPGLGPGTYFACEAELAGWIQTFPNAVAGEVIDTCDDIAGNEDFGYKFTASSGTDETGNDFGNFELISKSGTKFNDLDGDGVWDAGEPGLEGWTINLYRDNGSTAGALDATDTWLDDDVTDATGAYSFGALGPGTYIVCEESMTGWIQTFPNAVAGEVIDTCDEVAGQEEFGYLFTATSGINNTGNDFGNFELITKSGTKFEDLNGDGVWDMDEPGLEGWTIYLYDDTGTIGVLEAGDVLNTSTTTASDGTYSFGNLGPGAYIACEDLPAGWVQTFPDTAGGEVIDTCDVKNHAEFGYAFTAASGDDQTGNDFGNFELITKSGSKFNDLNGDGVWDAGEPGLADWTIYLYDDTGTIGVLEAGDVLNTSTTTDSNGDYSFTDLGPGSYIVCEDLPVGWTQTFPDAAGGEVIDTCDVNGHAEFGYAFTAASGGDQTDNDFGNSQRGTKSGVKYEDLNADGTKDAEDLNLSGWTIVAFADDGDGDLSQAEYDAGPADSDVTDGGGYELSLLPGDYVVCEELLSSAWTQSAPGGTACDGIDTALNPALADGGYAITVTSGSEEIDNDFGNFRKGSKSGTKFNDVNNNQVWDMGEPGLAGWAIHLFGTDGQGSAVHLTTTTNGSGLYTFSDLIPGSYTVCEVLQPGWTQTFPTAGANCATHTDGGTITPAPIGYAISITSGENETGNDFGNFQPPTQEGCTPGFWQGGFGSQLWNTVGDPQWTANGGVGTNPFIHTTKFSVTNGGFFPSSGNATVDNMTMIQIVGSGGTNSWPRKAARDLIAAYLNASFGLDYPATTAEILADWNAAVAGGTNGFKAFHAEYDAFNNLGCAIP